MTLLLVTIVALKQLPGSFGTYKYFVIVDVAHSEKVVILILGSMC